MAYITDTGYIHEDVQRIINNCDIYCIESNHDPRLLMMTHRQMQTKQRILSSLGHLSNEDCAYTLGNIMGPNTKQIVFLHKSKEANTDEMLLETFTNILTKMGIDVFSLQISIARQKEVISYLDYINIKDVIKQ
jgi:Metal-dependent hydrolases of the beta-lactamase superfamily I